MRLSERNRVLLGVVSGYAIFALPGNVLFRFVGHLSLGFAVVCTLYGMLFAFLGGAIARRIAGRRRHRGASAIMAMLICAGAAVTLLTLRPGGNPWPALVTVLLMSPMTMVKASTRLRTG
jgi:hypothetical protein